MKAWIVRNDDGYATVIFAETRNKAKLKAQCTDVCEDMEYIEINPRRFKEADAMYRGNREMDWYDSNDKRFLVEHGWHCEEPEVDDCNECDCRDVCDSYKQLKCEYRTLLDSLDRLD